MSVIPLGANHASPHSGIFHFRFVECVPPFVYNLRVSFVSRMFSASSLFKKTVIVMLLMLKLFHLTEHDFAETC
jgi:hypothetical protein